MARVTTTATYDVRRLYSVKQLVGGVRTREKMCLEHVFNFLRLEKKGSHQHNV